jgi:16S rRNA (uracil1498-N3)-methyltransferase
MARRVRIPLTLPEAGEHVLEGAPARYLTRILRLGPGDRFTAFDPAARREAEAHIVSVDRHTLTVRFEAPTVARVMGLTGVTLVQCAGKGDKVDEVVRAATALGVSALVIATSERSVVRGPASAQKLGRLTAIALDAARQSGRGDLPELTGPLPLDEALAAHAPADALKLCLTPGADTGLGRALAARGSRPLVLLVGPEGGFSEAELAAVAHAGFEPVRLGSLVLRTELAGAAALGAVLGVE